MCGVNVRPMPTESNENPAPADEMTMPFEAVRDMALRMIEWRRNFDRLFITFPTATLAIQAKVSESRLWRYRSGEEKWLSLDEYLKLYAVMTMTAIPEIMDDAQLLEAAARRPRRKLPNPNPKQPRPATRERVPDPFKHLELE